MPLPEIIKAELLKIDNDKKLLICYSEDYKEKSLIIRYGVSPENSEFNSSIEQFWVGAKLNIIDCAIDDDGYLVPTYIILEPDYLIDASAIAECFQVYLITPLHYFRNKLETIENRSYLLLGNLANYFLDELIFSDDIDKVTFNEAFLNSFKQSPFEYTSCQDIQSDSDFRKFMNNAKQRFDNIKRVIKDDFPKLGINIDNCTLEPSFFSAKYGFQGRLDMLYTHPNTTDASIIELKSGQVPYPSHDKTKIGLNHKVQTYVYRLMIDSVFGRSKHNVNASILYAAANTPGENIRKAILNSVIEKSILNLRNQIIINEYKIIHGKTDSVEELFHTMFQQTRVNQRFPQFYINRINKIELILSESTYIEKTYFYRYIKFISRELYHQKIGDIEYETPTGVASLWNSKFSERAETLDAIYNLSISKIVDSNRDMVINFKREVTGLVNFREGDICIVYPKNNVTDTVLTTQILKGTIVEIRENEVTVRFRYKQKNHHYFNDNPYWAIEHDSLDSSYNNMYKTLYKFITSSKPTKDLLLGIRGPGNSDASNQNNSEDIKHNSDNNSNYINYNINNYPENIITQAISAEDYFLIVGPPGTGKTSIFARRLIEEYYKSHDINIMVIANTNRAVDELCDAINAAFGYTDGLCENYIRIGTELSCADKHRHRLLQNVSEQYIDRESLRETIDQCRIWVSTLASVTSKPELFSLKKFNVAIIDEASQILEPQIIGLLPEFDKFIMIGDHNQLSTIVMQEIVESKITETHLNNLGITDCRDSLFERLLRRCINMNWSNSYTQLTKQGRMHNDIAAFPANNFYTETLLPALTWQTAKWEMSYNNDNSFDKYVATGRNFFISTDNIDLYTQPHKTPTPSHKTAIPSNKINEKEADVVIDLLHSIYRVYNQNNKQINHNSIGIIAPYRNQIALIRDKLMKSSLPDAQNIMIDTVERFQGSQRNIIIMSFCINQPSQLKFLCNMSNDGKVDRKLNVSITRAREQMFLIGNANIMKLQPVYKKLLDFYKDKMIES
ncbi:MAG: AAA family ATPase [Fermentimonas sp.]|nr:AAA family ATPase [Fermentimonas sp.]